MPPEVNAVEDRTPAGGSPTLTLTVGAETSSEKTWLVTRPITLIGSKRPAHILLHHPDVEPAHCVITTDGRLALLTDLRTVNGTRCNGETCRTRVLAEGDRIELGDARILVTIHESGEPSVSGPRRSPPAKPLKEEGNPLILTDERSDRAWCIELPVALVGTRDDVDIVLPPGMSQPLHAVIFRHARGMAAFDLTPAGGMRVNGWPTRLASLAAGDQLVLGSSLLRVGSGAAETRPPDPPSTALLRETSRDPRSWPWPARPHPMSLASPVSRSGFPGCTSNHRPGAGSAPDLETILKLSRRLEDIGRKLTRSWNRLNDSQAACAAPGVATEIRGVDLARRVAELDALDAALRGQLFDLTRAQEDLLQCQAELLEVLREWGLMSL